MALRTDERTIGDFTYRVNQHGYREGRALLPIVLRALGPTLGTLLEGASIGKGGEFNLETNLDLSAALTEFSASLSEQDLEQISSKMSERCWILNAAKHGMGPDENGNVHLPSVEEDHWPPRYGDWMKWLAFALEVNFASFLGGAGSVSGALSAAVAKGGASPSQSQSTSTGDSGASSAAPG